MHDVAIFDTKWAVLGPSEVQKPNPFLVLGFKFPLAGCP
jgi:hypothetical protein